MHIFSALFIGRHDQMGMRLSGRQANRPRRGGVGINELARLQRSLAFPVTDCRVAKITTWQVLFVEKAFYITSLKFVSIDRMPVRQP